MLISTRAFLEGVPSTCGEQVRDLLVPAAVGAPNVRGEATSIVQEQNQRDAADRVGQRTFASFCEMSLGWALGQISTQMLVGFPRIIGGPAWSAPSVRTSRFSSFRKQV